MSEFGNETAMAATKAVTETGKALIELLKLLFNRNGKGAGESRTDKKIKKEQLKQEKMTTEKLEAQKAIDASRGKARYKQLIKTGEELTPVATALTPGQLSRLNTYARTYGLAYSAISNKEAIENLKAVKKELKILDEAEKTGGLTPEQAGRKALLLKDKETYEKASTNKIIVVRTKDLQLLNDITERMNSEIKISDIDREREALLEKGRENLSPEELERLEQLEKAKEAVENEEFDKRNARGNEKVVEDSVKGGNTPEAVETDLSSALNLCTEREFGDNSATESFICDPDNPDKFVRVTYEELDGRTNAKFEMNGETRYRYVKTAGENGAVIDNMDSIKNDYGYAFGASVLVFNDKKAFENYRESMRGTTFEEAVNSVTEKTYGNQICYACDRNHPDNYMEVTSEPQMHEGHWFTNTEYRVFNNGAEQHCDEFSHGKFTHYVRKDGENSSSYGEEHWQSMKQEMKDKGGFTDDMLVFKNKEDYLRYKDSYENAQAAKTAAPKENTYAPGYKDYMGTINELKAELKESGYEISDKGELVNAATGEPAHLMENAGEAEKLSYAKAVNTYNRINVYKELNDGQVQKAFIEQQKALNKENFEKQGSPEGLRKMYEQTNDSLYKQGYDLFQREAALVCKAKALERDADDLSSAAIINDMQKEHTPFEKIINREKGKEKSTPREEHRQSKAEWEKAAKKQKGKSFDGKDTKEKTKEAANERQ